jgi:hypothetical protein
LRFSVERFRLRSEWFQGFRVLGFWVLPALGRELSVVLVEQEGCSCIFDRVVNVSLQDSHQPPQSGIKSPVSVPLICTGARRNPATCGSNEEARKRGFGPVLWTGGETQETFFDTKTVLSDTAYLLVSLRKSTSP